MQYVDYYFLFFFVYFTTISKFGLFAFKYYLCFLTCTFYSKQFYGEYTLSYIDVQTVTMHPAIKKVYLSHVEVLTKLYHHKHCMSEIYFRQRSPEKI